MRELGRGEMNKATAKKFSRGGAETLRKTDCWNLLFFVASCEIDLISSMNNEPRNGSWPQITADKTKTLNGKNIFTARA